MIVSCTCVLGQHTAKRRGKVLCWRSGGVYTGESVVRRYVWALSRAATREAIDRQPWQQCIIHHTKTAGIRWRNGCTIVKNDLDVSKLQTALDLIADWANDWQLSVSVDKCSVLKIGRGTAVDADFTLGGNVLPAVTHCRDLGVTIVSDLSSIQYISEIVSKAHQRANCICLLYTSPSPRD